MASKSVLCIQLSVLGEMGLRVCVLLGMSLFSWSGTGFCTSLRELLVLISPCPRHVAGVPKVLLDFAKEINAKLGPMEEQRERFGPFFYDVSTLGTEIWTLTYIWSKDYPLSEAQTTEVLSVLNKVVDLYCQELERISFFIGKLFKVSPWFVSPSEIKPIPNAGVPDAIKCELDDCPSESNSESGKSN